MADRYEGYKASDVPVNSALAAELDPNADGYAVVIGDPEAAAYVVHGTAAELAAFAARVGDAVLALAPHAHLTDAHLAEQLREVLLALDAPAEEPTAAAEDDPIATIRELVAEAHDRLPGDEFGPLCTTCAPVEGLATFRQVLDNGYLAEAAVQHFSCQEVEALVGMLDDEGRETWLRYHCTGDCDDLEVHGASEEDVALWQVMNEPPHEATAAG